MKLTCNLCGKVVSSEIPDDTVINAWIECPECVQKQEDAKAKKKPRAKTRPFGLNQLGDDY